MPENRKLRSYIFHHNGDTTQPPRARRSQCDAQDAGGPVLRARMRPGRSLPAGRVEAAEPPLQTLTVPTEPNH